MADQEPDVQQDSDRIKPELTLDRIRVRTGPARIHNAQVSNDQAPVFQPLTGVYEPSAIQQLRDGRFLVVEDEKSHPLSLVTIGVDGSVDTTALTAGLFQMFSEFWRLDDLEGLTLDRAGFVYGVTSHSRDDDGDEKKSREKLVRFRVEGKRVVDPKVVVGLKQALTMRHAVLAAAAQVRDVKTSGGLNIEALEISPDQKRLLIGFRSPLRDGRALIAIVENPAGIFESDEAPRVAPLLDELDLGGHGIRGMSYIPTMGAYLVIGGPASREPADFDLWRWSGEPGAPACRVTVPGLRSFEKAEGVCPAVIGGMERIVIVSDDGDRDAGRSAGYLLLDPAQLQTAA
jgi:Protein of unknown function (DUF3616)